MSLVRDQTLNGKKSFSPPSKSEEELRRRQEEGRVGELCFFNFGTGYEPGGRSISQRDKGVVSLVLAAQGFRAEEGERRHRREEEEGRVGEADVAHVVVLFCRVLGEKSPKEMKKEEKTE